MAPKTPSQAGAFELGPITGNCLEVWSPPETVENAHDTGTDEPTPQTRPNTNRT